ncbi:slime mold cyclic AMP receptor [Rhizoctonia solani AG-3 Rhs1AP]|uniref:Slime mold cyclic AMP receptor n=2 Tax=Rhizoctonia solani AG-3 TaxID=1086053 RepID=A0A074RVP0_9AGAM|nr:slime mold cyclic AMP receptor [Rhizoctonia solani AG-3 Rhs1AP]KEP50994.1 slime mold cyclic AMP receptor [Rhizoctonia solani 123E]
MAFDDEIEYTYEEDYRTTGNRIGLALIGATGMFSAVSAMILLGYIVWHSFLNKRRELPMVQGIRSFTHSALGVFLISLLLSDLVQGVAFSINFKWAADGNMRPSVACTAQGAVSQVGDLGSAIWSLAIAYYTFSLLFLFKKPPIWITWSIVILGWSTIIVLPIIGPYGIENVKTRGHFYAISGAWCWVGDGYQLERFLYVYMWIFLSLGTSLVLYGLVYLRFSGHLIVENGKLAWNKSSVGWSFGSFMIGITSTSTPTRQSAIPRPSETCQVNGIGKHLKTISKRLMLYPLVYSIVTIPVAVCRIGTLAGWKPPFGLYIFAGITFSSSGITNVILFIATRHSLLRKSVSIQPRIRVTTHQVTVLEDAHGIQAIHLNNLTIAGPADDIGSEKVISEDEASVVSAKYASSSRSTEAPLNSPFDSHKRPGSTV